MGQQQICIQRRYPTQLLYDIDAHVYWNGQIIKEADPNSFQNLGNKYGKDKHNVYYNGKQINAKTETFQVIGDGFSTDGKKIL